MGGGGGSIDELAETMVNFASNRLIPGLPSYVHRISILSLFLFSFSFFLYFELTVYVTWWCVEILVISNKTDF